MKTVYLDTKVWNLLAKEDCSGLASSLRNLSTQLAVGNFNRVELEQAHLSPKSSGLARNLLEALFEAHKDASVYIKDPIETIVAELWAIRYGGSVSYSYDSRERDLHLDEIKRRAEGLDGSRADELRKRQNSNQGDRLDIARHLQKFPLLRNELRAVAPHELKSWLENQSTSAQGFKVLADILQGHFPEQTRTVLDSDAKELLLSPVGMASRALVRANIYVFWRYASLTQEGQLATRSLFDDTFHLVNAVYCDAYLTCDADQKKYWDLILPNHCKRHLLDRTMSAQAFLASGEAIA